MQEEAVLNERVGELTVKVFPDLDSSETPNEWGWSASTLVHYHRDFQVEDDKLVTEDDIRDWYNGKKIEAMKSHYIFPVSALIHSGVWLSLESSFPSDSGGWDTSHVGAILIPKTEVKTKTAAFKLAGSSIDSWNDILSGNVYGFIVEDVNGDNLDSCWGFIGDADDCLRSGIESAEFIAAERMKKRQMALKSKIIAGVPLQYR
jgi:hypothetical protein